mgnify:FL=1
MENSFCPECYEMRDFNEVFEGDTFNIYGHEIKIVSRFLECIVCGKKITDPKRIDENFIKAYTKYRNENNLLHSEEIKNIREKKNLSQEEFAEILGCSKRTIQRIETGALQTKEQDKKIRELV